MEPSTTSSALLSFTAENVRSYSNEVHLSMLGTRLAEADAVRDLPAAGTRTPMSVLPVAGVFGANASGKSTLLRAMHDMRTFVLSSFAKEERKPRSLAIGFFSMAPTRALLASRSN